MTKVSLKYISKSLNEAKSTVSRVLNGGVLDLQMGFMDYKHWGSVLGASPPSAKILQIKLNE